MSSHLEAALAPEPDAAGARGGLTSVYVISVILSACSILYELLAAQTMALLAANTVVWYSLVVGTFLAAMGFGSYWSRRLGRRSAWSTLFRIEIGLTALGILVVPLLHLAHTANLHLLLAEEPTQAGLVFFGTAAAVVVGVGVLTGVELPLLMRLAREPRDERGVANTVLGLDYIDFPVPNSYDLAKLYSREFFHFVRKRIAPGGFAVFDSTGTSYLTSWNEEGRRWPSPASDWPVYVHTLRKAGFPSIVPFLTTLERDNAEGRRILDRMELGPELEAHLRRFDDPAERERQRAELRAQAIDQLVENHIVSVEQGFIMVSPEAREFRREYEDPGIELDVLNRRRFELAFAVDFPMPEEVDTSKVNSILRPTFPTTPWWKPRQPF